MSGEDFSIVTAIIVVLCTIGITIPMAAVQIAEKAKIDGWEETNLVISDNTTVEKHYGDFVANSKIYTECEVEMLNGVKSICLCVAIYPTGNKNLWFPKPGPIGNDAWISSILGQKNVAAQCNLETLHGESCSTTGHINGNGVPTIECATEPPPVVGWWTWIIIDIILALCMCGLCIFLIYVSLDD